MDSVTTDPVFSASKDENLEFFSDQACITDRKKPVLIILESDISIISQLSNFSPTVIV